MDIPGGPYAVVTVEGLVSDAVPIERVAAPIELAGVDPEGGSRSCGRAAVVAGDAVEANPHDVCASTGREPR